MPRPLSRYLLLAAVIHVALATTIFLVGHFRLFPNTFDQNGIAITFAIDGTTYQRIAGDLAEEWRSHGFRAWLNAKAPLHSRLHSLSFIIFGKLLGHNILAAEPLNLLYYLAILICVYFLGREVFNAQTGFIAAVIVALWPSFLFHSTQFIRDPVSIACLLALMLVFVFVLSRELAWAKGIAIGIAGALLATLFWLARGNEQRRGNHEEHHERIPAQESLLANRLNHKHYDCDCDRSEHDVPHVSTRQPKQRREQRACNADHDALAPCKLAAQDQH